MAATKKAPVKKAAVKKAITRKAPGKKKYTQAQLMEFAGILKRKNNCTYRELLSKIQTGKAKNIEDPRFDYQSTAPAIREALKKYLASTAKKAAGRPRKTENNQPRLPKKGTPRGKNGGARPGAGRKKGAATKKTREIADKLVETGEITPLEYMLGVLRETPEKLKARYDAGEIDAVQYAVEYKMLVARRDNAAEKACPYIHPRLASIEAKVESSGHEAWLALLEGLDKS